ncbi:MAG TPA: hypothetical protein VL119_02235 [Acidimicrobiia bacterium]|nr:hypothetical protein [Acidimicrobiia bacterium]
MTEIPTMTGTPVPPYDDDYDEPEFRPRPRRRARALTFVLGGALLIAAGFLGGVLLQKHEDHGSSSTASRARSFAAATGTSGATGSGTGGSGTGAGRGFGGFGGGSGFGGAGGAVTGTVKLVDGKNVYVTETNGNIVKVVTNASSQLTKTDAATIKDVAPGEVLTVRGTQNSDGSYTATSVILVPAVTTSG